MILTYLRYCFYSSLRPWRNFVVKNVCLTIMALVVTIVSGSPFVLADATKNNVSSDAKATESASNTKEVTAKSLNSAAKSAGTPEAKAIILKPYTAELKGSIKGLPISASGHRSLKKTVAGAWELAFDADAGVFMGMSERSNFHLMNDGAIKPEAYEYKRSGFVGSDKEESAKFNWQKSLINWKNIKNEQWDIKLQNGAMDNLSYQTQLRIDLGAGKKEFNYLIADDDEIYQRNFSIEGEEVLQTEAGKLNTVKMKINRGSDSNRNTYIWFAKDWDYFFVKLLQTEGGSEYTVEIINASIDGKPIKGI